MEDKIEEEIVNQRHYETYDDGSDSCKESLIIDGQVTQFSQDENQSIRNPNMNHGLNLIKNHIVGIVKNKEDSSKKLLK